MNFPFKKEKKIQDSPSIPSFYFYHDQRSLLKIPHVSSAKHAVGEKTTYFTFVDVLERWQSILIQYNGQSVRIRIRAKCLMEIRAKALLWMDEDDRWIWKNMTISIITKHQQHHFK